MVKKNVRNTQFWQFFQPLIDTLMELGGSGQRSEVKDLIAAKLNITEEEQSEQISSGQSRYSNKIDWARLYLAKVGLIDSSTRGVWTLTEKGRTAKLSNDEAFQLVQLIRKQAAEERKHLLEISQSGNSENIDDTIEIPDEDNNHRTILLHKLMELPADGFERLCQRLLRESGFESVTVTGKSGDGGIDGIGVLQVNPFVSFKVLFQCKRYSGSVTPSQVRDFHGAMMGRADKGIILTTGTFTSDAKKEAVRDGVLPIELVDGEKLLDMFETLELGLKPKKAYEIDETFFDDFK
jgi:restriction system protein